jgi:hypothetical protein
LDLNKRKYNDPFKYRLPPGRRVGINKDLVYSGDTVMVLGFGKVIVDWVASDKRRVLAAVKPDETLSKPHMHGATMIRHCRMLLTEDRVLRMRNKLR